MALTLPLSDTHIPEILGNSRGYEVSGNATDLAIVTEFFHALTTNHTWATGGSNDGEYWGKPAEMGDNLNTQTEESCTQYNVLKVARHLYQWSANSTLFDFYERAIWNGILGNQNRLDPAVTSFIYMLPMGSGVKKPWGKSNYGFVCCWGTLSEQFSKLADSIFFESMDSSILYVNQFVSASLDWRAKGFEVKQETDFPFPKTDMTSVKLTLSKRPSVMSEATPAASSFTVKLRVPSWAKSATVSVNGKALPAYACTPGEYAAITRTWASGDVVTAKFEMGLRAVALNDARPVWDGVTAWVYGPHVLAGLTESWPHNTSKTCATMRGHWGGGNHQDPSCIDSFKPPARAYTVTTKADPRSFITRVIGGGKALNASLEFEATDSAGKKLQLIPISEVMLETYTVYFDTMPAPVSAITLPCLQICWTFTS